jgi:2-polyprenyl-6-methoxyphenol hydroxylase-like FAD-dependent oxidoreductase
MRSIAERKLIEPFRSLVLATAEPFAQVVQDFQAPKVVVGRSVLVGDAACLVRPHLGTGSAKAVDDAVQLAEAVCGPDFAERGCLRAWQYARLEAHHGLVQQAKAIAERYGLGLAPVT